MTWKIRHEGSPRFIEGLSQAQVVEGLQDGLWEATDEVMGPKDPSWVAIENHPQLADVAADLEPPPPKVHEDETRLDMNPLIDVALVLLIFFIMTTSYAALQHVLRMPTLSARDVDAKQRPTKDYVEQFTIRVQVRQVDGRPEFKVENDVVPEQHLAAALNRYVRDTRKTAVLIDADDSVPWAAVVAVQDAAKGAEVHKVHWLVRRKAQKPPAGP